MNRKRLLKETQFKVSPQKALHDEAIETNQILQNIKNKATLSARGALVILPKARRAVKEMQFKVNPSKALHDDAMETNQILEEINKSLDDLPEQVRAKAKGDKGALLNPHRCASRNIFIRAAATLNTCKDLLD